MREEAGAELMTAGSFCTNSCIIQISLSRRRVASAARKLAIASIECCNRVRDVLRRAAVVDHVVGSREALRTRELRSHDRTHFALGQPAASSHSLDLLLFHAIHDQYAIYDIREAAALEQ